MKTISKAFICASVLAVVAIAMTGCKSSGYAKGGNAAKGMDKTSAEVQEVVAQTDLTLTTLSNLVYAPKSDLVPQFKAFSGATKKLNSVSDKVDKQAAKMRELANAYFAEWDAGMTNISNADLRKKSEERRAEVSDAFQEVADSLKKSKEAFDPFVSDLTDVEQVLSLDLTQGGIDSVQDTAKSAIAHGEDLRAALTDAAKDIEDLARKMSASGGAPEATE